ncbi:hypothetical protein L7F22_056097 [Adiantum nelumboides]|nr:hypothetical protein [Adiantum nelumboides]
MESSTLASLFMQEGNLPGLPLSWATSGESVEELQRQLTSTSLELQSTRETATLQSRINEAKICRLQGLLDAARKERDEARTKCSKLRECLLQLSRSPQVSVLAAESPSSCLPSSISSTSSPAEFGHPASPSADTMSFQELTQTVCVDEGMFEHDGVIKLSPQEEAPDVQDIFTLQQNVDPSSVTMEHTQQQFSIDILNENVSFKEEESLDLTDFHVETFPRSSAWEPNPSSKSCWDMHASDDSSDVPMFANHPSVQPQSTTVQLKVTHVEASEPDATTVLVDALPERGKLLQAVTQAGPLLQNLLLAGPLPQWRYPPPQLNTVEIPKVPLVSSSLPLKYPSSLGSGNPAMPLHHNPLVNFPVHVSAPQFADERGVLGSSSAPPSSSSFASKSGRNTCYGGRKLRRLSPIGVK